MIELDEELVNLSRRYLPEWSDCSDIDDIIDTTSKEPTTTSDGKEDKRRILSCFDHPRTTMHYQDAFAFFLDEFGSDEINDVVDEENDDAIFEKNKMQNGTNTSDTFDVIIMDALDPDDFGDFVDKLYNE